MTDGELVQKEQEMLEAIRRNAVVVSPCISPGERQMARTAFECQGSLIVLKNQGFPPLYKPQGAYFDACAAGRLLMLAPKQWAYTPGKKAMTRWDACVLNALAQQICRENAAQIHYKGIVPENLPSMIDEAMKR